MTPNLPTCPECGARLPADGANGVCPRCLLLRGFESQEEEARSTDTVHLVLPDDAVLAEQPLLQEFGDYELLLEIGRGGMGVIYQARQRTLDRVVAVKLIRAGTLARPEDIARFKVEAAATARLRHPGIVAIHEIGERDGRHFYCMDFVAGPSLATALYAGPLAPRRAAECVRAVSEAIHYAHEHDVLHRDLKPSNILLDVEGSPHITDFGLAKLLHSDSELTLTGAVLGSPNYMPPEQARGQHAAVSARSDVYSLGAILYECLTGRPPFTAATPLETLKLVAEQEPVSPRVLNPSLPRDLETICLKCLAKEPRARYATAKELAEELERFLDDKPILARPAGVVERTARWCRRKPALASLFSVLLVSVVALVTVLASSNGRVRRALSHAVSEGTRASNALTRAEAETRRAESSALENRINLYSVSIYLADRAVAAGNIYQARRILESLAPAPGESDLRGFEWGYLWRITEGDQVATLRGHTNEVNCLVFSPDGKTLASGGADGSVRLWDFTRRSEVRMAMMQPPDRENHVRHSVMDLDFSGDGQALVVACDYLMLLEAATLNPLAMENLRVKSAKFLPESPWLLAGARRESTTTLFDWQHITAGRFAGPVNVLTNQGGLTAVTRDGQLFATVTGEAEIHLWRDGGNDYAGHRRGYGFPLAVEFSKDGRFLAVAAANLQLEVRDTRDGRLHTVFTGHQNHATAVDFSPDGRQLVSASADQSVRVWDRAKAKELKRFIGHAGEVRAARYTPDGRQIVSGGADGTIRVWDLGAAHGPLRITNGFSPYLFSPDSRWLAGRTADGRDLCVWNVQTGERRVFAGTTNEPAFITSDGREFATCSRLGIGPDLKIEFWSWAGQPGRATVLIPDRHGPASSAAGVKRATTEPIHSSFAPEQSAISFHARGSHCVVSYADHLVQVWCPTNGQRLGEFKAGREWSRESLLSPDGRWLAMTPWRMWAVWDWRAARVAYSGELPPGTSYYRQRFTPDSGMLMGAGSGNDVRRFDLETGTPARPLVGHENVVNLIAVSSDGKTLASMAADGLLKLWSLPSSREVVSFPRREPGIGLMFSPDDTVLALLTKDHGLELWRVSPPGINRAATVR